MIQGLLGAIRKMIYSAWDGYTNFGSDIGGYRGTDTDPVKEVFIRVSRFGMK
jgi:alpha-glucosidase (family GH31 glycosyl hydrolase)